MTCARETSALYIIFNVAQVPVSSSAIMQVAEARRGGLCNGLFTRHCRLCTELSLTSRPQQPTAASSRTAPRTRTRTSRGLISEHLPMWWPMSQLQSPRVRYLVKTAVIILILLKNSNNKSLISFKNTNWTAYGLLPILNRFFCDATFGKSNGRQILELSVDYINVIMSTHKSGSFEAFSGELELAAFS